MGKWVQLDIDVTSERAYGAREENSYVKTLALFSTALPLSSEYEGEILLPNEMDLCTAPDVNRFKIYMEKLFESKTFRTNYTGWIINRKIYSREELINKGIMLLDDKGERYFLTDEGIPIIVEKGDEPAICFLERIKKQLMTKEIAKKVEIENIQIEEVKSSVIPTEKEDLSTTNSTGLKRKNGFIKPLNMSEEEVAVELLDGTFLEYESVSSSQVIGKNIGYARVKGKDVTSDLNSDEIMAYFFDESVIRTRFYKQELANDYEGNPNPGKKRYITGWIYNGETHDLKTALELRLISQARMESLAMGEFSHIVVTKSKNIYPFGGRDTTFGDYLKKCIEKDGIAK